MSSQTLHLKYEIDAAEVGLLLMGFSIAYTVMAPIFGVIMDCGLTPIVAVLMGNLTISLSMFLLGEVYTSIFIIKISKNAKGTEESLLKT